MTNSNLVPKVLGAAGLLALLAGPLVLLLAEPLALGIEPLTVRFSDGVLDAENKLLLRQMVGALGIIGAAAGAALVLWAWAWGSLGERLPLRRAAGPPSPPRAAAADLLILTVAAIGLGVLAGRQLDRGFGFDEIATVQNAVDVDAWWDVFSTVVVFNNHVPFSALSRASRSILGTSEWAYRLPALVLGLLSLPAAWALGRRMCGPVPARIGVLFLAASPLMAEYVASARGYTGLLLFATMATIWWLACLDAPRTRTVAAYSMSGAVAVWFHLYGLFVLAAHGLYLLWLGLRRPSATDRPAFRAALAGLLGASVLAVILLAPLLPRLLLEVERRGRGTFQPGFLWAVAQELNGGIAVVAALVGLGLLACRREPPGVLAIALLTVSSVVPWLMRPFDLYPRFFMFLLPVWTTMAGVGVGWLVGIGRPRTRPEERWRRWLAASVVGGVLLTWSYRSWTTVPEEGYREAAEAIAAQSAEGDIVLSVGVGGSLVGYYLQTPVRHIADLDDLRRAKAPDRAVTVVYRRGMHESGPDPMREYLEQHGTRTTHRNLTVFRLPR